MAGFKSDHGTDAVTKSSLNLEMNSIPNPRMEQILHYISGFVYFVLMIQISFIWFCSALLIVEDFNVMRSR